MALIAISAVYLGYSLIVSVVGLDFIATGLFLLVSGCAILAIALRYDLKDPDRLTRFADNAFWLHLISAPMIINGLVLLMLDTLGDTGDSIVGYVLVIVIAVSLFGLAINRRALLASSLLYAGTAILYFVNKIDMEFGTAIAVTLIILGAAVVFLGAGWHPARRALLTVLPNLAIFPREN